MSSSTPLSTLTKASYEFIELLAFIYLQHQRTADAAALLELLVHVNDDIRLQGAVALAQLRAAQPEKALRTIEAVPLRSQLSGPLKPAFQLLRAQILYALDRHPEAAAAMQAFIAARRQAREAQDRVTGRGSATSQRTRTSSADVVTMISLGGTDTAMAMATSAATAAPAVGRTS